MEIRASYLLVGGFVLALTAVAFGFIVWLARVDVEGTAVPYRILFTGSVTGLNTGSPVRYRGIPVGEVTRIRINPANVEEIEVIVEVAEDTPIKEDTAASLEVQGITGVAYIQLSGGTSASLPLAPGEGEKMALITSKSSTLEKVFETAPELLDQLNALVARATLMFSDRNLESVSDTLSNLKNVSGAVADRTGDIENTLAALNDTAETFKALADELRGHGSRLTVEAVGTMRSARSLLDKTGKEVEAVRQSTDRTLARAETFLGDTSTEIKAARESADRGIASAETFLAETGAEIKTASRSADETLTSARSFMDTTGGHVAAISESATRLMNDADALILDEVRPTADTLRKAAEAFDRLADEMQGMVADNRQPIRDFTSTGLYEFSQFVVDARAMAEGITRLVGKIEQDPARFFFGNSQSGFKAQ